MPEERLKFTYDGDRFEYDVELAFLNLELGSVFVHDADIKGTVKHTYSVIDVCLAVAKRISVEEALQYLACWHEALIAHSPEHMVAGKLALWEGIRGYVCYRLILCNPRYDRPATFEKVLKMSDKRMSFEEVEAAAPLYKALRDKDTLVDRAYWPPGSPFPM